MQERRPRASDAATGEGAQKFSPGYSNYVLTVLFFVYVFNLLDRNILAILLDPIKEELGASDTAMGFLTGFAFAVFYTFAGIPIARLADRGVRRSIIAAGLAGWSVMTALCGVVQTFGQLALARIGVGVGEAAGTPPAHSLISDYFPLERRATAISIYNTGISVGVMLGLLAGGWVNEFFGWRVAFFVVGGPGLLFALVVRFTIREPPRGMSETVPVDASSDSLRDVARFLIRLRSFVLYSIGMGLTAFGAYGFLTWVPAFMGRVHGMGTGEIGTWIGIETGVAGAIGAVLGGVLADRLGRRDVRWYLWVPSLGLACYLPFVIPFLLVDDPTLALIFYFPSVLVSSVTLGPIIVLTHSLVKVRMRALASAVLLFLLNIIGMGAGPQFVGILNDLLNPTVGAEAVRYSLLAVAVAKVLAITLFLLAARTLHADMKAKDELAGPSR